MSTDAGRPATEWDLRIPKPEQLRSFMEPTMVAFAEATSGPEADDWAKLQEPDRWLCAFESADTDIGVGGAAAFSVRLTVPGGEVPAAAVTAVGVRPDYRRRGVLSALMRQQLRDIHARGEPLAILWASEGAIYQRFGYGLATMDGSFEVATSRTGFLRQPPPQGRVRLVSEKESVDLIPPIYDAMRAVTPGAITRSTDWWTVRILADPEYSRQGASEKYRVVYQADGEPEGYAIYRIKSDWDHLGPKGVLQVNDAVATSPQALRGLWRYLFDVDLVRSVKAEHVAVPNPLQQVLAEPRALGLVASDGIWARLVDAPAALRARRYMTTGELVLDIADNVCEWNAGRWRLSTSGSVGATEAVVEATDDSPDLALDVADLGAIYLGGTSIAELAAVGRIKERREGAVAQADALFATGSTPWCNTMF